MSAKSNQQKAKILVVEDDPSLREALVDTLCLAEMDVREAGSAEAALGLLAKDANIDLIVSDVNMGAMSGHDLLRKVKSDFAHIPVLLITAYASINESVQAMKEGAVDYLVKPFDPNLLVETVSRVVCTGGSASKEPIAEAESSRQLLQLAARVAQSESTVLLLGESGTGKEVLAKYIHEKSPRHDKPFVAINCAAIPENMLEAMLFGHEKGAYTGAHSAAPGKFEQANGGTLLLDEISEMDIGLQAKLLRVLQEREVERLGGRKSIKLDVRVIATSNRDMRIEVAEGKFREDLYFRLSVLPLQWAPLRDRKEDIVALAKSLLSKHGQKQHRRQVSLSAEAIDALRSYLWPGNVRELDNVMQRALILQTGDTIFAADLGLHSADSFSQKPTLVEVFAQETRQAILAEASAAMPSNTASKRAYESALNPNLLGNNGQANASASPFGNVNSNVNSNVGSDTGSVVSGVVSGDVSGDVKGDMSSDMKRHEFEIIVKTLKQENGSKKNTADKLGISPRTLRYKLARLREEGYTLESV